MKRPRPDALPRVPWVRLICAAMAWLTIGYLTLVGFMAVTGGY